MGVYFNWYWHNQLLKLDELAEKMGEYEHILMCIPCGENKVVSALDQLVALRLKQIELILQMKLLVTTNNLPALECQLDKGHKENIYKKIA